VFICEQAVLVKFFDILLHLLEAQTEYSRLDAINISLITVELSREKSRRLEDLTSILKNLSSLLDLLIS